MGLRCKFMAGGTSPYEWIIPVVGATHLAYNAAVQAVGAPQGKITTPGSPAWRESKNRDRENYQANLDQQAQQTQAATLDTAAGAPQTAEALDEARRRAAAAGTCSAATCRRCKSRTCNISRATKCW